MELDPAELAQLNQQLRDSALAGNRAEVISWLTCGAQVNAVDAEGFSALHLAAAGGHKAVVKVLIEEGADVDMPDNSGDTPLVYCTLGSHLECMKLLLDAGANINHVTRDGNTLEQTAETARAAQAIKFLKKYRNEHSIGTLDLSHSIIIEGILQVKSSWNGKYEAKVMVLSAAEQALFCWVGKRKFAEGRRITRIPMDTFVAARYPRNYRDGKYFVLQVTTGRVVHIVARSAREAARWVLELKRCRSEQMCAYTITAFMRGIKGRKQAQAVKFEFTKIIKAVSKQGLLIQGELLKQNRGGISVTNLGWRHRYFLLNGQTSGLQYWASQQEMLSHPKAARTILFADMLRIVKMAKPPNSFKLQLVKGGDLVLQCADEQQAELWVNSLCAVIPKMNQSAIKIQAAWRMHHFRVWFEAQKLAKKMQVLEDKYSKPSKELIAAVALIERRYLQSKEAKKKQEAERKARSQRRNMDTIKGQTVFNRKTSQHKSKAALATAKLKPAGRMSMVFTGSALATARSLAAVQGVQSEYEIPTMEELKAQQKPNKKKRRSKPTSLATVSEGVTESKGVDGESESEDDDGTSTPGTPALSTSGVNLAAGSPTPAVPPKDMSEVVKSVLAMAGVTPANVSQQPEAVLQALAQIMRAQVVSELASPTSHLPTARSAELTQLLDKPVPMVLQSWLSWQAAGSTSDSRSGYDSHDDDTASVSSDDSGWYQVFDPVSHTPYWCNLNNGQATWVRPSGEAAASSKGWVMVKDTVTGLPYFIDTRSGTAHWTPPDGVGPISTATHAAGVEESKASFISNAPVLVANAALGRTPATLVDTAQFSEIHYEHAAAANINVHADSVLHADALGNWDWNVVTEATTPSRPRPSVSEGSDAILAHVESGSVPTTPPDYVQESNIKPQTAVRRSSGSTRYSGSDAGQHLAEDQQGDGDASGSDDPGVATTSINREEGSEGTAESGGSAFVDGWDVDLAVMPGGPALVEEGVMQADVDTIVVESVQEDDAPAFAPKMRRTSGLFRVGQLHGGARESRP